VNIWNDRLDYIAVDSANFNFADFADLSDFVDFVDFSVDFAVDHTLGGVLPVGGLVRGVADVVFRLFLFITRGIPFSRLPGLPGGRSEVLIPFLDYGTSSLSRSLPSDCR
jgi:hypothetical protein